MKRILLLGDSIRMGYDEYVKESMRNVAEVYYPTENCTFAEYILRNVHFWADELELERVDAVHWNAGLWDTVRIYGDEPLTRIDVYAEYIGRIHKRLAFLFPGAKLIFATSTPVIEAGFIDGFECRSNRDIEAYNRAAREVIQRLGGQIDDLYALLKDAPESLHSDQTHFYTADATELIGGQVNRALADALGLDESLLVRPDKHRFVKPGVKGDKEAFEKRGHVYWRIRGVDK